MLLSVPETVWWVRRQLDRVHDAVTDTVTLELSHLSSDSSPARVTLPLGVDAADVRCTFRRRARQLQATVPLGLNSAFEILAATGHTELLRTLFGAPPQRVQPCVHRRHLTAHSPHAADATQQKSFHAAVSPQRLHARRLHLRCHLLKGLAGGGGHRRGATTA